MEELSRATPETRPRVASEALDSGRNLARLARASARGIQLCPHWSGGGWWSGNGDHKGPFMPSPSCPENSPRKSRVTLQDNAASLLTCQVRARRCAMQPMFVRFAEVIKMTGLSKATIYRQMEAGNFPKTVKLSTRAVAWRRADIDEWLGRLIAPDCRDVGEAARKARELAEEAAAKLKRPPTRPRSKRTGADTHSMKPRISSAAIALRQLSDGRGSGSRSRAQAEPQDASGRRSLGGRGCGWGISVRGPPLSRGHDAGGS